MRISDSLLLAPLALAACHSQPATAPPAERVAADKLIPCAKGNAPLESACSIEIAKRPDGPLVTVRNPDGGFHRLLVTRSGRGVIAADGAQQAVMTPVDAATIEIAIGGDRYRLPATLGR